MTILTMKTWPHCASLVEDEKFRKEHWNNIIKDCNNRRVRIIMHHDMSDLPMDQLSDTELNRATFSKYYWCNCGKGGTCIFTQTCGWEEPIDLFTGIASGIVIMSTNRN
mmetsp:Transcript_20054/g.24712  ORF Transcript_20054/g.24712 Transcript_20054/m.24712 type:complete len:109 (+) Transcript_20054:868-1194(+)